MLFSVFRGYRKGALGTNGLKCNRYTSIGFFFEEIK